MEALLSFFAAWCEPVMVVCERCDCWTPRDDSPRVQDVFGGMSIACQGCADADEAEERARMRFRTPEYRAWADRQLGWIEEDGK